MVARSTFAVGLAAVLAVTGTAGAAQRDPARRVDGIAAVVNDEIVSIGEVDRAARLLARPGAVRPASGCGSLGAEAIASAPEVAGDDGAAGTVAGPEPDAAALESALECLIDGTLVYREARRFPQLGVTREQAQAAYRALADSFPDSRTFEDRIDRLGLSPEALLRDVHRQLLVAAYVDTRFRATVDIGDQEARTYYEDVMVPDMRSRGIEPPAFEGVSTRFVIPILREREVNRRVESWVEDLRARATIRRMYP